MVKKLMAAFACVAVLLIVGALWLRVRKLEQSVDALTRELQSRPQAGGIPVLFPAKGKDGKRIFRLIETEQKVSEPVKGPFHPDVDRAMMIDAIQTVPVGVDPIDQPSAQYEVSPDAGTISIPDLQSLPDSIEPFRKAD